MGRSIAFKRYFDLARTVDCPASWRTVYMLGLGHELIKGIPLTGEM
jgi:hypothetical protein